ncbi:MAG TPA: endoribonuclease MazF [Spirochaetota bacterium]|nr:endoribonuclease MazF [Spirochaetota bacterium]HPF05654.1 endoribonuclease MazF [Spirochaetota bacterium]HPJ42238.1 endoribonuclease MazF [Spirochaetota bacterium]HPR36754.1 endoribonuclease MazF [Spirochaetota bacterium]HRX47059.1 endoribonuclease MazF [Spirochaetota bacterium]
MVNKSYIPERGDLVWLNFTPQSGHEQMGKRPALVLSPKEYNLKTGLAIFCPVTGKEKGYPFEVKITSKKISGVILSDQVKSLDWKSRNAEYILKVTASEIEEVLSKLKLLL